jgi:hypothetical protein
LIIDNDDELYLYGLVMLYGNCVVLNFQPLSIKREAGVAAVAADADNQEATEPEPELTKEIADSQLTNPGTADLKKGADRTIKSAAKRRRLPGAGRKVFLLYISI